MIDLVEEFLLTLGYTKSFHIPRSINQYAKIESVRYDTFNLIVWTNSYSVIKIEADNTPNTILVYRSHLSAIDLIKPNSLNVLKAILEED